MSDKNVSKSTTVVLRDGWRGVRIRVSIRVDADVSKTGMTVQGLKATLEMDRIVATRVNDISHNIARALNKALMETGVR